MSRLPRLNTAPPILQQEGNIEVVKISHRLKQNVNFPTILHGGGGIIKVGKISTKLTTEYIPHFLSAFLQMEGSI